jgi:catechol 2,3-dioxygenase-like lactoylglutathione lyase family enzyme
VLHHVSLEVPPDEAERMIHFWELLGFEQVEPPEPIAPYVTWLQRDWTQIHLIHSDAATVPQLGHAAVVVDDFEETVSRLRESEFDVEDARELWGASRAFAIGPGGHRVELMEEPPA